MSMSYSDMATDNMWGYLESIFKDCEIILLDYVDARVDFRLARTKVFGKMYSIGIDGDQSYMVVLYKSRYDWLNGRVVSACGGEPEEAMDNAMEQLPLLLTNQIQGQPINDNAKSDADFAMVKSVFPTAVQGKSRLEWQIALPDQHLQLEFFANHFDERMADDFKSTTVIIYSDKGYYQGSISSFAVDPYQALLMAKQQIPYLQEMRAKQANESVSDLMAN